MKVRRLIGMLMCACMVIVLLCGCGSGTASSVESGMNENGNYYAKSDSMYTEHFKELPGGIDYNGKDIYIKKVSAYEARTSDYAYTLYVVVDVDASSLDDAEFHWLSNEDISASTYITSEKNEYDFESSYRLGVLEADKTISFVFISSPLDNCRHSFGGGEITVSVLLTQEETYEYTGSSGKSSALHKSNIGMYTMALPNKLPSANKIPKQLQDYVVKWLAEKASSYK